VASHTPVGDTAQQVVGTATKSAFSLGGNVRSSAPDSKFQTLAIPSEDTLTIVVPPSEQIAMSWQLPGCTAFDATPVAELLEAGHSLKLPSS
jgi:hypothetical protein